MTDPNGCQSGWIQCELPLPLTSASVAAGASATLTLTPRDPGTPTSLNVVAAASSWTIDSIDIGGVNYLNGAIAADIYLPTSVTSKRVAWAEISNVRPLTMIVTNYSAGALVFRATVMTLTARKLG